MFVEIIWLLKNSWHPLDIAVWEMKKQLAGVIRLNAKQQVWKDNDAVQ